MNGSVCRCGSKSHKKISHSRCVLNRKVFELMMTIPQATVPTFWNNTDDSVSNLRHSLLLNVRKRALREEGNFFRKYQHLVATTEDILQDLQAARNVERQYFQRDDIQIPNAQTLNAPQPTDVAPVLHDNIQNQAIDIDNDSTNNENTNTEDVPAVPENNTIVIDDDTDEDEDEQKVETANVNNCSICLCPISGSISFFSKCHHGFHTNCINKYKESCKTRKEPLLCPLCRHPGKIQLLYM